MPDPIWVLCEGSGCPGHLAHPRTAICSMCGYRKPLTEGDVLDEHMRMDVLAMIDRGDFEVVQRFDGRAEDDRR